MDYKHKVSHPEMLSELVIVIKTSSTHTIHTCLVSIVGIFTVWVLKTKWWITLCSLDLTQNSLLRFTVRDKLRVHRIFHIFHCYWISLKCSQLLILTTMTIHNLTAFYTSSSYLNFAEISQISRSGHFGAKTLITRNFLLNSLDLCNQLPSDFIHHWWLQPL